jgi:hypothetical protein
MTARTYTGIPPLPFGLAPTTSSGLTRLMTLGAGIPENGMIGLTRQNACGISENTEDDDE